MLIPVEQAELVITHPELRYAVLMPWLPGRTLEELLSQEDALTPEQRLMAAQKLAETLALKPEGLWQPEPCHRACGSPQEAVHFGWLGRMVL